MIILTHPYTHIHVVKIIKQYILSYLNSHLSDTESINTDACAVTHVVDHVAMPPWLKCLNMRANT